MHQPSLYPPLLARLSSARVYDCALRRGGQGDVHAGLAGLAHGVRLGGVAVAGHEGCGARVARSLCGRVRGYSAAGYYDTGTPHTPHTPQPPNSAHHRLPANRGCPMHAVDWRRLAVAGVVCCLVSRMLRRWLSLSSSSMRHRAAVARLYSSRYSLGFEHTTLSW